MYMGPFFLVMSGIFYGICHLVASRTSSNPYHLKFHQMVFDSEDDVILDAIAHWVHIHPYIRMVKENNNEIIVEATQRWNSFGVFYYFRFEHLDETSLMVSIASKPKLIGDTHEQQRFIENFREHIFEHLEAAS